MGGLTGSTRNSHRLLTWAAQAHGLAAQNALAEELFKGYFTQVGGWVGGWLGRAGVPPPTSPSCGRYGHSA
jgi:hypothetical protein